MWIVPLLPQVDITKLFYSPEEEAGANCLEEQEKAEPIATLNFFFLTSMPLQTGIPDQY